MESLTQSMIDARFHEKKLTNEQKLSVLQDYIDGMKIADIAEKYSIDKSYPANLAKRLGIKRRL